MTIFDKTPNFNDKVNFVDKHNVFVGYHVDHHCCECVGWFIEPLLTVYDNDVHGAEDWQRPPYPNMEPYVFDVAYFNVLPKVEDVDYDRVAHTIAFKLVCEGKPDMYLHLFNCHNGFYTHDFTFVDNGFTIQEGNQ